MSLEFHPSEISRACFVGAVQFFHHQALQPEAYGFVEQARERFGIPHHLVMGEHEDVVRLNGCFKYVHAFNQRFLKERRPVFVQDVKHKSF